MKRLARAAIITKLRDLLDDQGSWCGETHMQKACFIAQEGLGIPLGFDFILYKHGPFSFDLRSELSDLRSDGILRLEPQSYPYGPRLKSTDRADAVQSRFPRTLRENSETLDNVAHFLGGAGVVELEKLATSIMILREHPEMSPEQAAGELSSVKPHIEEAAALDATRRASEFLEEHLSHP